jgi:hypothetical protein
MDKEFNTTFIPKKTPLPTVSRVRKPTGFLALLAGLFFFTAIFSMIGVYIWENTTINEITSMQAKIENARSELDNDFITELKNVDKKLRLGAQLLDGHHVFSPFITMLEDQTLPSVEYSALSYSIEDGVGQVFIQGQALTFTSISQQAEIFNKAPQFKQHFFDGFTLDDTGRVNFGLEIELDLAQYTFAGQFAMAPSGQNTQEASIQ